MTGLGRHLSKNFPQATNPTDGLHAGDVFVESWGYDQTNIDYYQVLKVTPTGVRLRKICARDITDADTVFTHRKLVPAVDEWVEVSWRNVDAFLSERGAFRKVRRYDAPDGVVDYVVDISSYSVASLAHDAGVRYETRSEYGH